MKIVKVKVEYGELRSFGLYNNKKFSISYEAELSKTDKPDKVRGDLLKKAIQEVSLLHGDKVEDVTLTIVKKSEKDF